MKRYLVTAGLLLAPFPAGANDGFYFGGHVGYLFGTGTATLSDPTGIAGGSNSIGQLFGGVQGGWQTTLPSRWMVGIELDLSFMDARDGAQVLSYRATGAGYADEQLEYLGTARGRLGYAMGAWTPFVTGGLAFASTRWGRTDLTTGNEDATPGQWRLGYTLGAGVDYALGAGQSLDDSTVHDRHPALNRDVVEQAHRTIGPAIRDMTGSDSDRFVRVEGVLHVWDVGRLRPNVHALLDHPVEGFARTVGQSAGKLRVRLVVGLYHDRPEQILRLLIHRAPRDMQESAAEPGAPVAAVRRATFEDGDGDSTFNGSQCGDDACEATPHHNQTTSHPFIPLVSGGRTGRMTTLVRPGLTVQH